MNQVKIKKGKGFCNGRVDLIQERRLEQAQRYERRKWEVGCWMNGQWRVLEEPCRCGRNHHLIEVRSAAGIERMCPFVLWMNLALHGREFDTRWATSVTPSRFMKPLVTGG